MTFQPGQSGNPKGKPKGAVNKAYQVSAKRLKAQVSAEAGVLMEGLLKKAHKVIDQALNDGNAQVAMWTIEKVMGKSAKVLPASIDIKLDTMDGVMHAAKVITEMCLLRKMSVPDATETLQMLSNYASFRAFERIDELKEAVAEMKAQAEAKTIDGTASHIPSWGRLSESTQTANVKPAE